MGEKEKKEMTGFSVGRRRKGKCGEVVGKVCDVPSQANIDQLLPLRELVSGVFLSM